jgi:hypothetical protein
MAQWWNRIEKAIDLAIGLASRRPPEPGAAQDGGAGGESRGLVSGFEAKMAGVLVSALREAFNRDAARLEAEKEHAENERRRAELALQLEIARQAAEREAARLRAVGGLATVVWLASLLFVTVHPPGTLAARIVLGLGWACLTGAIAAVLLGYRSVKDVAEQVPAALGGARPSSGKVALPDLASWLAVAGLALAASSLLVSL